MAQTLIQTITVGAGGASSIDFTGIANTFTDLMVVVSARSTKTGQQDEYPTISFNGSSANFSARYLYGNGSGAGSNTASVVYSMANAAGATANTFGNAVFYIPNYAGSTFKSIMADGVSENNATAGQQLLTAGLWSQTAAITSISLTSVYGATWSQGSTASLYGVKKDNILPSAKATGGNISFSGGYWYHTFTASGNFVPSQTLTCDYLIVAGGGGGSTGYGGTGGAGAGGYRAFTGQSFSAGSYAVVVGAGGSIDAGGSNSSFNSLTSGGGAGTNTGDVIGSGNTPSTTPSQGNNGGRQTTGSGGAGGGGGASAVGASTSSSQGGSGGAGSTWLNGTTYAGGGGGSGFTFGVGAGGAGGGGAGGGYGSGSGNGVAGTANTGGGGGGGGGNGGPNLGGAGGSGVVIVRYAA
jgi:hypothetical protein